MPTFFLHKTIKTTYVAHADAETQQEAIQRIEKAWSEREKGETPTADALAISYQGKEESHWRVHDHT